MGLRGFFQEIHWGATLRIAAIRIFVSALLWSMLMVISSSQGREASAIFSMIFSFLVALIVFVLIAIPAVGLSRANIPWVGLIALPAWLIVISDPILKLIHTKRPEWIPVDDFRWFNPPVLAVLSGSDTDQT